MSASKYNLTIEQGATFSRTLRLKDDTDTPINLTGSTFRGQLAAKAGDTPIVAFTFTLADQNTNPGEVTMSLTATQTAALPTAKQSSAERVDKELAYDVERVIGSTVERIIYGVATVSPEATTGT